MIRDQLLIVITGFLYGLTVGGLYCLVMWLDTRIPVWPRIGWKVRWAVRFVRDLLYGTAAGILLMMVFMKVNDGVLHGYVLISAITGWMCSYGCNKLLGILKKRLTHRKE